jgi:hypothetical protein
MCSGLHILIPPSRGQGVTSPYCLVWVEAKLGGLWYSLIDIAGNDFDASEATSRNFILIAVWIFRGGQQGLGCLAP